MSLPTSFNETVNRYAADGKHAGYFVNNPLLQLSAMPFASA
jgi:hypothetical protein